MSDTNRTHLIFEGAELSGKSSLMSRIYPILETKHASSANFMDGCFWINTDIGLLGGNHGLAALTKYTELAEILQDKPILFEKHYLSDTVYRQLSNQAIPDYSDIRSRLIKMNFAVVLTTFIEDESEIKARLSDRVKLYPHYGRIAKDPGFYIAQQHLFREEVKKSGFDWIEIPLHNFDANEFDPLKKWMGIT